MKKLFSSFIAIVIVSVMITAPVIAATPTNSLDSGSPSFTFEVDKIIEAKEAEFPNGDMGQVFTTQAFVNVVEEGAKFSVEIGTGEGVRYSHTTIIVQYKDGTYGHYRGTFKDVDNFSGLDSLSNLVTVSDVFNNYPQVSAQGSFELYEYTIEDGLPDVDATVYVEMVFYDKISMRESYCFMFEHKAGSAPSAAVAPSASAASISAVPTASKVYINAKDVSFEAYNIDGSNYFKLRDLAYSVNGTDKQFDVSWDGTANAINLLSSKAYTATSGEMSKGDGNAKTAQATTSKLLLDGTEIQLTAYNIGGNNYFKLRDIGKAFNFAVDWDGANNAIQIVTSKSYSE